MKRSFLYLWVVCCIMLVACGERNSKAPVVDDKTQSKETEKEDPVDEEQEIIFTSLREGLAARWDMNHDTDDLQEEKDLSEAMANAEYDAISGLLNIDIKDKEFGETVRGYITAVKSQSDAMQYYFTDNKKFNELYFENGLAKRSEYMRKLVDTYNFSVKNKYSSKLKELLNYDVADYLRFDYGESVDLSSDYGDVTLVVNNVKVMEQYDPDNEWNEVDEGTKIIAVEAIVKNKTYDDGLGSDTVDATTFMGVTTEEGFDAEAWFVGYQFDGYNEAATACFDCRRGAKVKVALPFVVDADCKYVQLFTCSGRTMMATIEE